MKHGDFTQLAENYALYRPGYSPFVRDVFLAMGDVRSALPALSAI